MTKSVKEWWKEKRDTVFWGLSVFCAVLLIGGALRLSMIWRSHTPITMIEEKMSSGVTTKEENYQQYMKASGLPGLVAASRNGKRYYYPWCAGLNRIKEANKIWFSSEESAEAAGYTIASGCEGL